MGSSIYDIATLVMLASTFFATRCHLSHCATGRPSAARAICSGAQRRPVKRASAMHARRSRLFQAIEHGGVDGSRVSERREHTKVGACRCRSEEWPIRHFGGSSCLRATSGLSCRRGTIGCGGVDHPSDGRPIPCSCPAEPSYLGRGRCSSAPPCKWPEHDIACRTGPCHTLSEPQVVIGTRPMRRMI